MRKIIHVDMDAFYAQVEMRDNPELKGKPVIVGGNPDERGVVATCSYEARKYGIHSAMPCRTARQLCPGAIFVRPRFEVYKGVSHKIGEIFKRYTDKIEFLSLDEAFLDVTENKKGITSATQIAKEIKLAIWDELHLTGSAGVSYNKFLAKIASDYEKPNGLTVITPDKAQELLDQLPIQKFFLVGKVTEEELRKIGVHYGRDLRRLELSYLVSVFKKRGYLLYDFARGIDEREVESSRIRKSIGAETTFSEDIVLASEEAKEILEELAHEVSLRVKRRNVWGKNVTLKIKFSDFSQITRSMMTSYPIVEPEEIRGYVEQLMQKVDKNEQKVRLLGITLSHLVTEEERKNENVSLFEYLESIK
nr:DNA polymerase IV [uncultured Niameybacter sp.]